MQQGWIQQFQSQHFNFSTDINSLFTESGLNITPVRKKLKAIGNGWEAPQYTDKKKIIVCRTREFLLDRGMVQVEFPVEILYDGPDSCFRKTHRTRIRWKHSREENTEGIFFQKILKNIFVFRTISS